MKKAICGLLTVVLCLSCVGCKPENVDKNTYKLGKKAINIIDSYLNFEEDKEQTKEKLDKVSSAIERLRQREIDEKYEDSLWTISVYTRSICFDLAVVDICVGKEAEILEARNRMAECLNEPQKENK